jgi:RNA polymerase sigma factor (sigma-70 family)
MDAEATFRNWRPLAWKIAGGYMRKLPPAIQRDDIFAAADMGLWQGLLRLGEEPNDPSQQYYLMSRIRGAVGDELRRQDWSPRRSRLKTEAPQIVYGDGVVETFVADTVESDFLELDNILDAIEQLGDRDRWVLGQHVNGAKQCEIAAELALSEPRISQLLARIRKNLGIRLGLAA